MKNLNAITRYIGAEGSAQRAGLFSATTEKNLTDKSKVSARQLLIDKENRQSLVQAVSTIIFVIVMVVVIAVNVIAG